MQESCDARRLFLTISFLDLLVYLDKHNIRCARTTLKRDKIDIVAAHIARSLVNGADMVNDEDEHENDVVLEEIGEENDQEESTDTGEKVIQIKITARVTTKATLAMIMRTMKTVRRTIMTTMMSATMRVYKSVTSCVLPN